MLRIIVAACVAASALALPSRSLASGPGVAPREFVGIAVHRLPSPFDSVVDFEQRTPENPPPLSSAQKIETKFLLVSGALIVADAAATVFSVSKPSRRSVLAGLIGGVGALAVGSAHLGDEGSSRSLARVTTAVGGVTTGVAFWRAVTPQDWHDLTLMNHAAGILSNVRAEAVVLPTGAVGRRVGWAVAFR